MCQGLESYALVHPFGLSSATTTRQFGMGGPVSCVWDEGFANPAFAAMQTRPNAAIRVGATRFDHGPSLTSGQLHFALPLRPNESGLQLSVFSMHSSAGMTALPQVGAVAAKLSEDDISLQYGRRLSPRLAAGIGVSPASTIRLRITTPTGVPILDVKATPDYGARVGLVYAYGEPQRGDNVGLVCDYYQETAKATGFAVGGAAHGVFYTDLFALGACRHVRPDLLLVGEYQRGSSHSGQIDNAIQGWHIGGEYQCNRQLALRAGLNQGHASYGAGYVSDRWQVAYAYINRWNDSVANPLFGSSDTHQLQATCAW